ncbi:hypothetical protein CO731_01686 [Aminobacter sp. MSH1]|uniref:hypothetical protein n=1 Tax=Aminobacter sp. MSH1 TaxID=374606 RepID=UPI000D3E315C|nr:hypothetical protein [Aminobacter sp. MSH1]AWC22230.1 hypothetical protein CO731_01686 [Aminobacter sp. MSH1]
MEWIIGIAAAVLVLAKLFGGRETRARHSSERRASTYSSREYATIFENGRHHPVTSEQAAGMFAGIRGKLKEHRNTAKAIQRLADKFAETGRLDEDAYAKLANADVDVGRTLAEAETLNDKLYFNSDSVSARYYKFVDDLSEVESDIESAREEIADIRTWADDGDFMPQKLARPKATKEPTRGQRKS